MLAKRKIDEAREKNAIRHKLCDLMEIIIETLQIEIKDIRLNVLNLNFSKNCPFIPRASSLSPSQTNPKSYKQKHIWAWNRIEIIIMEMRICERNCWKVCPATDVCARTSDRNHWANSKWDFIPQLRSWHRLNLIERKSAQIKSIRLGIFFHSGLFFLSRLGKMGNENGYSWEMLRFCLHSISLRCEEREMKKKVPRKQKAVNKFQLKDFLWHG